MQIEFLKKNIISYKRGRFLIRILRGLPFCLFIYTTNRSAFKISKFWKMIEITILKLNTIIYWGTEEEINGIY